MATVQVGAVGAERCHLDPAAVLLHQYDAELGPDVASGPEELPHAVGRGVGGDVVVVRRLAEQQIAHAAPGQQRGVSRATQLADDGDGRVSRRRQVDCEGERRLHARNDTVRWPGRLPFAVRAKTVGLPARRWAVPTLQLPFTVRTRTVRPSGRGFRSEMVGDAHPTATTATATKLTLTGRCPPYGSARKENGRTTWPGRLLSPGG